jgi:hypothetical protein
MAAKLPIALLNMEQLWQDIGVIGDICIVCLVGDPAWNDNVSERFCLLATNASNS